MTREDDLVARLRAAADVTAAAGLPAELRAAAFVLAFREAADPTASPSPGPSEGPGAAVPTPAPQGDRAVSLADSLGVEPDLLDAVFDVRGDDVDLILPRRVLEPSLRKATIQVILLTVAARQGAGIETWTDVAVVRETCDRMGVLDSNFSRILSSLNGNGLRLREVSGRRQISMTGKGFASAASLVEALAETLS